MARNRSRRGGTAAPTRAKIARDQEAEDEGFESQDIDAMAEDLPDEVVEADEVAEDEEREEREAGDDADDRADADPDESGDVAEDAEAAESDAVAGVDEQPDAGADDDGADGAADEPQGVPDEPAATPDDGKGDQGPAQADEPGGAAEPGAPDDRPVAIVAAGATAEAVVEALDAAGLDVVPAFDLIEPAEGEDMQDAEARAQAEAVDQALKLFGIRAQDADDGPPDETPLPDPAGLAEGDGDAGKDTGTSEALALLRRGKATREARQAAATGTKRAKVEKAAKAPVGDTAELLREALTRDRDGWFAAAEDVRAAIDALLAGEPDHAAYQEATNRLHSFGSKRRKEYDRLSLLVKSAAPKNGKDKPAEKGEDEGEADEAEPVEAGA